MKKSEKVGLGLFGATVICSAAAAALARFFAGHTCVELPMPHAEFAAVALLVTACLTWFVGALNEKPR